MAFLKTIIPFILEWVWGKVAPMLVDFFNRLKVIDEIKDEQKKRDMQTKIVETLRMEILRLRSSNQPVPIELEKKLYEETRKLINM